MQADKTQIDRLLNRGEQKLREYAHPDPYIGESASMLFMACSLLQKMVLYAVVKGSRL